ncbi:hypothetical protein TWF718_002130 [Orbilia javanica]|uniref:Uncharacterized protein n=1 Tax=Orbilia javanica TaxID=47235 RepID=A0AAN8MTP6_9PEZI
MPLTRSARRANTLVDRQSPCYPGPVPGEDPLWRSYRLTRTPPKGGEGKVPSAVSLPWDFCKTFTAEEVAWLLKDGYSYEPHANDTLLFFRADDRKRWQKASRRVLEREIFRQGFLRGDTWLPRYRYELVRYGRTLLTPERDEALTRGDLFRWEVGPESQRILDQAKEILNSVRGERKEMGKRKREAVREDIPDPEYRPVAPEPKRRRVAGRAASQSVQPDEHEDVVMTDVREELVVPTSGPMPESALERLIPHGAAMEGLKEEPQSTVAAPERRKRARKAATGPAPAKKAAAVEAKATPAPADEASAGELESCGWREVDGSVCGSVFSSKLELQRHVLISHVPMKSGLPQGQANWLCRFGRCEHSYVDEEPRKESGIFTKADTLKSHIRYLLDVKEFACRFSAEGCRKRCNRLNDMNTHAGRCKFNPSPKEKTGAVAKGRKGKKSDN